MIPCRRRAIWAAQAKPAVIMQPLPPEVNHGQQDETRQDADADAETSTDALPLAKARCPKCGKKLGRGRFWHEKYCKG